MGWVNENWIGKWHGLEIIIFFEKNYPGVDDHKDHFGCWLPDSRDSRYMKVNSKHIFAIYRPDSLPCRLPLLHLAGKKVLLKLP